MCIWFPSFHIFLYTFYNKFDDTYQFLSCKKAYCVKRQDFFSNFFKTAFYGVDTKPEP